MLCAAGLTQHDPILAELFRVERLCDAAMEKFYQVVDLDPVHGASRELLAGMAAQQRWQNRPMGYRAQSNHPKIERAMIQHLLVHEATEFKCFPLDAPQLLVGPVGYRASPGKSLFLASGLSQLSVSLLQKT